MIIEDEASPTREMSASPLEDEEGSPPREVVEEQEVYDKVS